MKSIFVSGLHEKTEFTDLEAIFSTFGELISCRVLRDAKTGMSRRIGYVNFTTAEAAMAALHALDSKAGPHGAPFVLQFADDDPSFKPEPTKRLFVRFIPIECSEQRIRDLFGQFGDITELTLSRDLCRAAKKEPQPWNMAYISYTRTEDATKAIASTDRQYLLSETHHLVVKAAENPATKHKRLEWRAQAQAAMPPPPVTTSPPVVGLSKAPPPYGAPVPPAYQQYAPQATNVFSLPAQLSQSSTPSVPSPQNMQNPQPQQWFAVQYPQQHAPQQHAQAPQMSPPGAPPQFVYRQQMPAVIEVPFTPPGNAMPQPPPGAHGLWPAPGPQQQGAQPRIVVPQPAGAPQLAPQMVPQPQFHPTYQHQPWNRAPPSPSHQMGAPTTLTQLPAFASPPTPHGYQPVEAFGAPYSHTSGHFSVSTNNTQPPTPSGHVVMFDAQRQAGSPHAPPPTATGAPPQQLYMRTPDGQFVPVQSFGPRQQR